MYLRTTQRKKKDGTAVRYVQLAHNHRVGSASTMYRLLRERGGFRHR